MPATETFDRSHHPDEVHLKAESAPRYNALCPKCHREGDLCGNDGMHFCQPCRFFFDA